MRNTLALAAVALFACSRAIPLGWATAGEVCEQSVQCRPDCPRYPVRVATFDWCDYQRCRPVPTKVYYPGKGTGPFPVIIVSHGLGGSRDGYEYLGRHWAARGYVSVHVQHKGSDRDVWRGTVRPLKALRDSFEDPRNSINRPQDVLFAIDRVERLSVEDPRLQGRLDLERIGVTGHGFGALTTLTVAGQVLVGPQGQNISLADPRVKAAISMSAPVWPDQVAMYDVYRPIEIPCLHMTGTEDDSPVGSTRAADRRLPFDSIQGADQYLIIFQGADHLIYCGHWLKVGEGGKDETFQRLIAASSTAFWDAYLKADPTARASLATNALDNALGPHATFERKLRPTAVARDPETPLDGVRTD